MLIKDGTGKGYSMKVDDENMAHVLAACSSLQHHTNHEHGEAYTIDIDGITTDGADYWIAILKNTADETLHITSLTLWTNTFNEDNFLEAYIGGTFVYATNGTAVVPTNCNAGSGKTATGDFYVNDGAGNITTVVAGSVVGRFIPTTILTKWVKDSCWLLPKNQCFMLQQSEAGRTLHGFISFYYHNNQWTH